MDDDEESKWVRRTNRFAYRFDQIGKTAVVIGIGVAAVIYCFQLPEVAPKIVGVVALIGSLFLARIVWRGMGRFYELDK